MQVHVGLDSNRFDTGLNRRHTFAFNFVCLSQFCKLTFVKLMVIISFTSKFDLLFPFDLTFFSVFRLTESTSSHPFLYNYNLCMPCKLHCGNHAKLRRFHYWYAAPLLSFSVCQIFITFFVILNADLR